MIINIDGIAENRAAKIIITTYNHRVIIITIVNFLLINF